MAASLTASPRFFLAHSSKTSFLKSSVPLSQVFADLTSCNTTLCFVLETIVLASRYCAASSPRSSSDDKTAHIAALTSERGDCGNLSQLCAVYWTRYSYLQEHRFSADGGKKLALLWPWLWDQWHTHQPATVWRHRNLTQVLFLRTSMCAFRVFFSLLVLLLPSRE